MVECYAGGECEQSCADADAEVVERSGSVAFESEGCTLVVWMIDSTRWRTPGIRDTCRGSVLQIQTPTS